MRSFKKQSAGFVLVVTIFLLALITILGLSMVYFSKEAIGSLDRINRHQLSNEAMSACIQDMFLEINKAHSQSEPTFPCEEKTSWRKDCGVLGDGGIVSGELKTQANANDLSRLEGLGYSCRAAYMPMVPLNEDIPPMGSATCPGNKPTVRCVNYRVTASATRGEEVVGLSEAIIQYQIDLKE